MISTTRIVAIDPGSTVGIATYLEGKFYSLELPNADAGPFLRGFIDAAERRGYPLAVACERYVIGTNTAKYSRQPAAAALIGVLDDYVRPLHHVTFELQNSSEAKKLGSDHLLQAIEWYRPRHGHANDAARHILYFLLRHYPEELELVKLGGTLEINRVDVDVEEDGSAALWLSRS